jgi:sigma-B regulation protein RsbU (phosphoserine phosphatase)
VSADDLGDAALFERAPCGYALVDRDGLLTRANAEFRRLAGRDEDQLLGTASLASLLSIGGRIFLETHLWPMLEHDRSVREVAVDLVRPDGTRVPVLLNADPGPVEGSVLVVVLETSDRHRYEQDLLVATRAAEQARAAATALAHALQETLIPPRPPHVPGLALAAAYRPAGDGSIVGGDFYDIFRVGPEAWTVVLGDVSGKGVSAATVTSFVRYTTRALALDHEDPSDLLHHLDRALHHHGTEHYCTLVLARLVRTDDGWDVALALAGHPPALLRHPDGRVDELGVPGNPVGLVDDAFFVTVRHALRDETVTLYTDGITEARGAEGMYGERGLQELIARLPHEVAALTDGVTQAALAFQDGVASDDIAVVTFAAAP